MMVSCVGDITWTLHSRLKTFINGKYSKDAFRLICEVSSLERAINNILCCYKIPLYPGSLFHHEPSYLFYFRSLFKPFASSCLILINILSSSRNHDYWMGFFFSYLNGILPKTHKNLLFANLIDISRRNAPNFCLPNAIISFLRFKNLMGLWTP